MPNHSSIALPDPEGIDAIIDSVAANPARAESAKSMLRETIARRKKILPFAQAAQISNEEEDLWDNVPV